MQVGGAVDGGWGDRAWGEEGGVVGAFFAGVQVGAFGVGAEEGGGVRDGAGGEGGEDLGVLLVRVGDEGSDGVRRRVV